VCVCVCILWRARRLNVRSKATVLAGQGVGGGVEAVICESELRT